VSSESARDVSFGRLVARRNVGGGLILHDLEPPVGLRGTYGNPGQYVSLGAAEKSTYFVLAGEPDQPTWQVLVRAGGDVANALLALPIGARVELSGALGPGFPVAEAEGKRLFVLATGSGVAAIRPVVAVRVRGGVAATTEVLLGVRSRADIPLADELAARRADGVAVSFCFSREPVVGKDAIGGYVQDALVRRARERPIDLEGAMIFAAGTSAMVDAVRRTARDLGLAEADVRTNY
jgi:NAD(P)H-flavin reductase